MPDKVVVTGEPVRRAEPPKMMTVVVAPGKKHYGRSTDMEEDEDARMLKEGEETEVTLHQYNMFKDKFEPVDEKELKKLQPEPRKGKKSGAPNPGDPDPQIPPGGYQRAEDASSKTPDLSKQPDPHSIGNPLTPGEREALKQLEEDDEKGSKKSKK
jgi:hypothetical protein